MDLIENKAFFIIQIIGEDQTGTDMNQEEYKINQKANEYQPFEEIYMKPVLNNELSPLQQFMIPESI